MRAIVTTLILILLPFVSYAQGQNRAGGWEWAISGLYQQSKDIGSVGSSTLNVDDEIGFGFNISYNFSNRLALGFDLDYLEPDYRAVLIEDAMPPTSAVIDHKFTQFNGRFKGTFNFIDAPFTPFVEAGLGWTFIDSNVADGPPITGCWWHPYWGPICDNFYTTFTETSFTYGAGIGFRYEFVGGTFVKASVNNWQLDGVGSSEDAGITAGRFEFGWSF